MNQQNSKNSNNPTNPHTNNSLVDALDGIDSQLSAMYELTGELKQTTDKILGSRPQEVEQGKDAPPPSQIIIHRLHNIFERLIHLSVDLNAVNKRIGEAL